MLSETTQREAARHVHGATITWGDGGIYDLQSPNPEVISLEDYAYGLAYTVRFRGQCKSSGRRVFYGVGEHNVRGAEWLLVDGHGPVAALAFLFHESGELPFGDLPGPGKHLFPGWREREKEHCVAINRRFNVPDADADLIKRWDIRMFLTERRDLMGGVEHAHPEPGYEAFPARLLPYAHPDQAAERFLSLHTVLRDQIARQNVEPAA